MIQMMKYDNPINNVEETLIVDINILNVDKEKWYSDLYWMQKGIDGVLLDILFDLDCTRIYKSGRPMMIEYPRYKLLIAEYFRFLNKITDYEVYNLYFDKLVNLHVNNILFEFNNPIAKKKPTQSKKQKARPNIWTKAETTDLFTGETRYIYENHKTGEILTSGNPDLLDELNAKRTKRTSKIKEEPKVISTEGIIFNFKKKKS